MREDDVAIASRNGKGPSMTASRLDRQGRSWLPARPFASGRWAIVARGPTSPVNSRRQSDAPRWEHCVIVRAALEPLDGRGAGAWRFVAVVEPQRDEWAACSAPLSGDGSYVDARIRADFDALVLRLTADGWNLVRAAAASEPWHAWRFRRRRFDRPDARRHDQ
jgi:hypothetical protein